jgi:hypothetical protein
MDELEKEKTEGLSWEYLADVPDRRGELGDKYQIPGWGLGVALFSFTAKAVIEELGSKKGEALLKKAIEEFGRARGRRIAAIVKDLGKPLTLKNLLTYGDMDPRNSNPRPADIVDGDFIMKTGKCILWDTAGEFGLRDFSQFFCKYDDEAVIEGYNPDIKLIKDYRYQTGEEHCMFRYIIKETNK